MKRGDVIRIRLDGQNHIGVVVEKTEISVKARVPRYVGCYTASDPGGIHIQDYTIIKEVGPKVHVEHYQTNTFIGTLLRQLTGVNRHQDDTTPPEGA